jgi:hypothetical protein
MPTACEIGCGTGEFGARFHAPCVTTDIKWLPGISVVSDARRLAFGSDSFASVIVCNPWGYGFRRLEEGTGLMAELLRVLRPGGTVIVIGHSSNPNCQWERISDIAESLSKPDATLTVTVERIVAAERFPGHRFSRNDGSPTAPNIEIRIEMSQP